MVLLFLEAAFCFELRGSWFSGKDASGLLEICGLQPRCQDYGCQKPPALRAWLSAHLLEEDWGSLDFHGLLFFFLIIFILY